MASNAFGKIFRLITWGESHGKAIGVVIDGCPAGLKLNEEMINCELALRAPGNSPYTTKRKEADQAEIYSGVYEEKTTGAPLSIVIFNNDAKTKSYEPIKDLLKPGHANFTYLKKYGIFDPYGGGRASARETACRVAAGAVAKAYLAHFNIEITAYIKEIGGIEAKIDELPPLTKVKKSPLFCPDEKATSAMCTLIEKTIEEGDSLGGIVEVVIKNLPAGLGDPTYDKLEANLASALMSIPAAKGFEIGAGFQSAKMKGFSHNDPYVKKGTEITTETNHAGGVLAGISTGLPLIARVAFKPPSSIRIPQKTVSVFGEEAILKLPPGSRHDPCVAIRAVPVVEAMAAIVCTDAYLSQRLARI